MYRRGVACRVGLGRQREKRRGEGRGMRTSRPIERAKYTFTGLCANDLSSIRKYVERSPPKAAAPPLGPHPHAAARCIDGSFPPSCALCRCSECDSLVRMSYTVRMRVISTYQWAEGPRAHTRRVEEDGAIALSKPSAGVYTGPNNAAARPPRGGGRIKKVYRACGTRARGEL